MKRWGLILILLVALGLRLHGLGFGLPNHQHAYTYDPDEWTALQILRSMDPPRNFNPHFFFDPTFYYYLCGGAIFAAHLVGLVRIDGNERFYFDHPEHLARMVLAGRLCSVILAVLTVWLVYLLARRLRVKWAGACLAALLLALHPSHVIHSHYMTVNAAVTFWVTLSFLAMESWIRRGGVRNLIWVGVAIGLALSSKYSAALLFPIAALAGYLRIRRLSGMAREAAADHRISPVRQGVSETLTVMAIGAAAFLAGTPYSLLAFNEFKSGMLFLTSFMNTSPQRAAGLLESLSKVLQIHLYASTPGILLAALAGTWVLFRRRPAIFPLLAAWLGIFFLISLRAGALATDGRFLPLWPFLAVTGGAGLEALLQKRRPGIALVGSVVALLLVADAIVLGRFTGRMPQEQASDWARSNMTGSEKVYLTGTALFYYPDLPLRELLQERNSQNYERRTTWTFVNATSYAEGRAEKPDVVFLSVCLPREPKGMEWLRDPDYEIAAYFPGKVRVLGKPIQVPLDLYDIYTWILRRKAGSALETSPP